MVLTHLQVVGVRFRMFYDPDWPSQVSPERVNAYKNIPSTVGIKCII
jgi:hypothetical protein